MSHERQDRQRSPPAHRWRFVPFYRAFPTSTPSPTCTCSMTSLAVYESSPVVGSSGGGAGRGGVKRAGDWSQRGRPQSHDCRRAGLPRRFEYCCSNSHAHAQRFSAQPLHNRHGNVLGGTWRRTHPGT